MSAYAVAVGSIGSSGHETSSESAYQQQHTLGHIDCPACESTRTDTVSRDPDSLLSQKFPSAALIWLDTRKPYLREDTYKLYSHHISQLGRFFGELQVQKIHLGHMREYQKARLANSLTLPGGITLSPWKKKAGASLINHELCIVQQILKRAGTWKLFGAYYEPLPLPAWQADKVMTEEEEDRLFHIAQGNSYFEVAYMAAGLTANTSAAGCELRFLRHMDLALDVKPPRIYVRADRAKNGFRGRPIPLNETAFALMNRCVERANRLGSVLPEHYIFPSRVNRGEWDPTKPASESWLKKQFHAMREAAALPWLKPHNLRHQCITKMLEAGVPEEVVRSIAGHVSERMMRHYAHTRIARQSLELDKIDPRHRKRPQPASTREAIARRA